MRSPKTYQLTIADINKLFAVLKEKYAIYAPVRIPSGGRYSGQESILYREVERYEEIEFRERSTYAMKEVITPITQTLFYFTDDEFRESKLEDSRDLLVFGRACDINAIKIQDQIYYENGGIADPFYQRRREKVKFALIECQEQFDGCFCCSTGSNVTDMHSIAFSFGEDGAYIEVKDDCFSKYFDGCGETDYEITFPAENKLKVDFPVIDNLDLANKLKSHPMWDEFDARCITCGACTVACSTCTCFETTDIIYTQNGKAGERRRTCSSCMVDGFDRMAGGACFRHKISEKYRYKILHKVYGHNARFHTGPMCVGCGRCSARCPQLIGYPETLNKLSKAIKEIKQEEEVSHAQ